MTSDCCVFLLYPTARSTQCFENVFMSIYVLFPPTSCLKTALCLYVFTLLRCYCVEPLQLQQQVSVCVRVAQVKTEIFAFYAKLLQIRLDREDLRTSILTLLFSIGFYRLSLVVDWFFLLEGELHPQHLLIFSTVHLTSFLIPTAQHCHHRVVLWR